MSKPVADVRREPDPRAPGGSPAPHLRLELTNVTKRWRKDEPPVLDALHLSLEPGTQTLVMGQNGAGKTTLLRIASGLIAADNGVVRLDGLAPEKHRLEYQRRVGFLAAGSTGLYARLTVARHLDLWSRLALVRPVVRGARIAAVVEKFELAELTSRRADRLSMGQRQRLRLALTFLHEPSLVLLDEPWSSLDESGIELVNAAVDEFVAGSGSALLCVPTGHDVEHADAYRSLVLENGKLVAA